MVCPRDIGGPAHQYFNTPSQTIKEFRWFFCLVMASVSQILTQLTFISVSFATHIIHVAVISFCCERGETSLGNCCRRKRGASARSKTRGGFSQCK